MNTNELRQGNWVYSKIQNRPILVRGITRKNELDITQPSDAIDNYSDSANFNPILLADHIIKKLVHDTVLLGGRNGDLEGYKIYNFARSSSTYILVHDIGEGNFFIGILNPHLKEGYSRVTRPFTSIHKLQNAYNTVYDKELSIKF